MAVAYNEIMRGILGVAVLHTTALIASAVRMCSSSTASGNFYAFAHIHSAYMCTHATLFVPPGLFGCVLLVPLVQVPCVCV